MIPKYLVERFNSKWKVDSVSGCWVWTASIAGKGYGQIKLPKQRKQIYAHRLSYLIHKGELQDGQFVCHTCDNPRCVNPEHLFVGTAKDNQQDMKAKGRHLYGSKNVRAVLNDEIVKEILIDLSGDASQSAIAKHYGVSQITISRIKRGERWAHLNPSPSKAIPTKKPLNEFQIKQVKAMLSSGVQASKIAKVFNVSRVTIGRIKSGERWSHIK